MLFNCITVLKVTAFMTHLIKTVFKNGVVGFVNKVKSKKLTAFTLALFMLPNLTSANVLTNIESATELPKEVGIKNVRTELTPQQKQVATKLTDAALTIMDVSRVIGMVYDEDELLDSNGLQDLTPLQKMCVGDRLLKSQGFYDFKYNQISKYVPTRTPEQLQNEVAILTPEVLDLLSKAFDTGIEVALKQEKGEPTDDILSIDSEYGVALMDVLTGDDTKTIMNLFNLQGKQEYKPLRQVLSIDSEKQAEKMVEQYIIWSISKCLLEE